MAVARLEHASEPRHLREGGMCVCVCVCVCSFRLFFAEQNAAGGTDRAKQNVAGDTDRAKQNVAGDTQQHLYIYKCLRNS